MTTNPTPKELSLQDRIKREMADSFDEELEMEIDDDRMDALVYALGDLYEHERTIPVPVLNPRLDPDLERLRSGEPDRPQFRGWASDLGGLWND